MYHFELILKCSSLPILPMQDMGVQKSQKMQRVIHNTQPLNCVGREEWEMAAWITPEIPRGFFNTTNRNAYSPEEDVDDEDENREEDRGKMRRTMIWSTWGSMSSKTTMRMTMK